MNTRLLIVDDHPAVITSLRYVFAGAGVEIESASTGTDTIRSVGRGGVDVVLLDIDLPDASGFEVLRYIKVLSPTLPVVMHSWHEEPYYYACSYRLGAGGYVVKGANVRVFIDCVRRAAAGDDAWTREQMLEIRKAGDPLAEANGPRSGHTGMSWTH